MLRRLPWLGLVLGALGLVSMGCETHRGWLRPKDDESVESRLRPRAGEAEAVPSEASKILGVDSEKESFFKNNRRSGAWSSEAREIERDLGVK